MDWEPITWSELDGIIASEPAECSQPLREFFVRAQIEPVKWHLSPWGDLGGGFWAVAREEDRVLWYNDIEEGFNVSRFERVGEIPTEEYWCNQDPLRFALTLLQGKPGVRLGPPMPIPDLET